MWGNVIKLITLTTNGFYGCAETSALFCFPCLLFGGEEALTKNISNISSRCKKHETSYSHMDNMPSLMF